jgi:hypothetical protein
MKIEKSNLWKTKIELGKIGPPVTLPFSLPKGRKLLSRLTWAECDAFFSFVGLFTVGSAVTFVLIAGKLIPGAQFNNMFFVLLLGGVSLTMALLSGAYWISTQSMPEASRCVQARLNFFFHLAGYLLINGMLLLYNLVHFPLAIWMLYPIINWGIFLAAHSLLAWRMKESAESLFP